MQGSENLAKQVLAKQVAAYLDIAVRSTRLRLIRHGSQKLKGSV